MVVTLIALFAGCGPQAIISENAGKSVEFETVKKGRLGFGFKAEDKPEYRVFRSRRAWMAFWEAAERKSPDYTDSAGAEIAAGQPYVDPDPSSQQMAPLGYVDFQITDMMIGAFFTGSYGYEVNIYDIRRQPDKLLVKVELKAVNADKPGLTAPYHIVRLDKVDTPVKFLLKDERPRY